MRIVIATLCVLAPLTTSLAVYSEYQRRQDEKQIAKLTKALTRANGQIDFVEKIVGPSSLQEKWSSSNEWGYGGNDLTSRVDQLCDTVTSAGC